MIISKNHNLKGYLIIIKNQRVEPILKLSYSGTTTNEDWHHSLEIKCKIEKARE